jgi:hypothetical protein
MQDSKEYKMIKVIALGLRPSEAIQPEAKLVEPDHRLYDLLPTGSVVGKKVLICNSKTGACVLPFLSEAAALQIVEEYQNLEFVYHVLKHILANKRLKLSIILCDSMQPGMYQIRLEARQLDWKSAKDNSHTVRPIIGTEFHESIDLDSPKMPYDPNLQPELKTKHWGQRKLLLCEIQFLTRFGHLSKYVVYAGAAPGTHTVVLARLFPDHTFDLWDPAPFSEILKEMPNVKLNQGLFTQEVAESYLGKRVLFLCDIRRTTGESDTREQEEEVMIDMEEQKRWCLAMRPAMAMLKFRLERSQEDKKQEYFGGEIYFQAWAPQRSTETRLLTTCDSRQSYGVKEYDDTLNFFNLFTRNCVFEREHVPIEGLCFCYDCTAEVNIIKQYLEYIDPSHDSSLRNIMRIELMFSEVLGRQSLQDQVSDEARVKRIRERQYINGRPAYLAQPQ